MKFRHSSYAGARGSMAQPDLFKGGFSILPFITALFTHFKQVKSRLDWIQKKSRDVGPLGAVHWFLDTMPVWAHYVFTFVSTVLGLTVFYDPVLGLPTPSWWKPVNDFANTNFSWLVFWWVVFAILFYFNLPAIILTAAAGFIPKLRETVGFSNASCCRDRHAPGRNISGEVG